MYEDEIYILYSTISSINSVASFPHSLINGISKSEKLLSADVNFSPLTIATMFDGTTVVTFTPFETGSSQRCRIDQREAEHQIMTYL
jgi:hypothetical protein